MRCGRVAGATGSPRSASASGREFRSSSKRCDLLLVDRVEEGPDRPDAFLAHHAFELRHQGAVVPEDAATHGRQEDLVALRILGKVSEVGCEAARNPLQPVAARALLA